MKRLVLIPLSLFLFMLAMPLVFKGSGDDLCVFAQEDNPCAMQDATISSLQLTNDALALQLTQLAPTEAPAIALENLPEACIVHVIASGDVPAVLADTYGVDLITLLIVNDLDDYTATQLQIGDQLVIPLEGCPIEQIIPQATATTPPTATVIVESTEPPAAVEQPTATPEQVQQPTVAPTQGTFEIPPTVENSTVMIISVDGVGDLTTESVTIRNGGSTIDLTGWFMADDDGNIFEFPPEQRLFSGSGVTISTRAGTNTPIVFFWGLEQAAFESGDVVILFDAQGNVSSTYRIP